MPDQRVRGRRPKSKVTKNEEESGISLHWAWLVILVFVPVWVSRMHYRLPEAIEHPYDLLTGEPVICEKVILKTARDLEEIGFRVVGTKEHRAGDEYVLGRVQELARLCVDVGRGVLDCEWDRQVGSSAHRFDIMSHDFYKAYHNLTNILFRISSSSSPSSKDMALLLNSHVDSTLPSPGASDDGISVGIMLDLARVLIERAGRGSWEVGWSINFLFNNAEESLQDASHLFSVHHPWAESVKAMVNLEAAGSTGPELLFQATSEEMIEVYSKAKRPYGTVVANDIFASGIIMSDTDFRQFDEYLSIPGLDMAVVGHSYFYHTRSDTVANIQPGVAQHFGENILSIVEEATSRHPYKNKEGLSTLERVKKFTSAEEKRRPPVVFYSLFRLAFLKYSFSTAKILYFITALVSLFIAKGDVWRGLWGSLVSLFGGLVGANLVAAFMSLVLGRSLSWFKGEVWCLGLYVPATLLGTALPHLYLSRRRIPGSQELGHASGIMLLHILIANLMQYLGIGSALIGFLMSLGLGVGLVLNLFIATKGRIHPLVYTVAGIWPLAIGTEVLIGTLDVFVPLTGRMGPVAPAEHIIASLVSILSTLATPLFTPFLYRNGRGVLKLIVGGLVLVNVGAITWYTTNGEWPFDRQHPRRLLVELQEDLDTGLSQVHIAKLDGAPNFYEHFVQHVVEELRSTILEEAISTDEEEVSVDLVVRKGAVGEWNTDFDTLYPVSQHLETYSIPLPPTKLWSGGSGGDIAVRTLSDIIDSERKSRSISLEISQPGVMWTVLSFDAHVLAWSLNPTGALPPPNHFMRHHVKQASFYNDDTTSWTFDMTIALNDTITPFDITFSGIVEEAIWPAKQESWLKGHGQERGGTLALFEKLDRGFERRWEGSVDSLFMGTVIRNVRL